MNKKYFTISIIKEARADENRTPFAPHQIQTLISNFPDLKILVQPSKNRCFKDEDYSKSGAKIEDIKDVYSHTAALSQSTSFIKKHNLIENVMADTAGSAQFVSLTKDKSKAAIASKLSAEIYGLNILKSDIQDDKVNFTRFLVFQKDIAQPEFKENEKYITSFLFKLKNKPAALYQALSGMAVRSCDMTKLQSFPEKGAFSSYLFLCEVDGHIEEKKIAESLSDLELHCTEFQLLGVFKQDPFRKK